MIKVLLKGPLLTQTGYGHHARTVLRALRTKEDLFDIYIQPIVWGQTSWIWEDNEERQWIDSCVKKTLGYASEGGTFDMSLQVTIPNEWEKIAEVNIGVTAGIETTKVAPVWIEKSFIMDKILTISEFSRDSYVNTVYEATNTDTGEKVDYRVQTQIDYIHYPVVKAEPENLDLDLETDFNFLAVAQLSPRKNAEQLILNFIDKFRDNENVGLIVKANSVKNSIPDRFMTRGLFNQAVQKAGEKKCKVYLLHGYLSDKQMAGLYTHSKVKALVSTTHGEGYGLPLFEAAYYGLPVIATDWSGHLDFLYMKEKQKNGKYKKKHMFSRISYSLRPVPAEVLWKDVIVQDSMWAFPEDGSIKMNLDEVYRDYGRFKKRAKKLQDWVCEDFEASKIYKQYTDQLEAIAEEKGLAERKEWLEKLNEIEII